MDYDIIARQLSDAYEQHKDIFNGDVWIGSDKLQFVERDFFENRLSIRLPENFFPMSEQLAKIKYPMEQRPPVIFTNEDTSINFALSLLNTPFSNDQVDEATMSYKSILHNINASYVFLDHDSILLKRNKIGYFDFYSTALDGTLYQMFAFTVIDHKMLHFMFNCIAKDMKDWKPIVLQVMQSIRNMKG